MMRQSRSDDESGGDGRLPPHFLNAYHIRGEQDGRRQCERKLPRSRSADEQEKKSCGAAQKRSPFRKLFQSFMDFGLARLSNPSCPTDEARGSWILLLSLLLEELYFLVLKVLRLFHQAEVAGHAGGGFFTRVRCRTIYS